MAGVQDVSLWAIQELKETAGGSFGAGCAQFKCLASKIGLLHRRGIVVLLTKAIQAHAW